MRIGDQVSRPNCWQGCVYVECLDMKLRFQLVGFGVDSVAPEHAEKEESGVDWRKK